MNSFLLEIATSDYLTTKSAVEGGADRIELCANLAEGGTTPSYAHIKKCRESFSIPIFPIIRPRGGDFLFTDEEFDMMIDDVKLCKQLGCDGIVIGLLNANGSIDSKRTAALVNTAYPLGVTFHRAFDRCKDPFEAMEQLIDMGCERILTSGQQPTVNEGWELIADLNKAADGRIIIMPGSGVREDNIQWLRDKTGCKEFHSSLRGKIKTKMEFIAPGFASSEETNFNNAIDPAAVQKLKTALLRSGEM